MTTNTKKDKKATTKTVSKTEGQTLTIAAPNLQQAVFSISGTAPYVQNKFSHKAMMQILQAQEAGTRGKNTSKKREGRDIDAEYEGSLHADSRGRFGIPCAAFRSACISACRVAGFQMTKAKLSVFIEPDTFDLESGEGLVLIDGKPEQHLGHVRLESGVTSIAVRAMFREWQAKVIVIWDGDQFNIDDMTNLLMRAGTQVGIGEGRPDSKKSHGMGWGTFEVLSVKK